MMEQMQNKEVKKALPVKEKIVLAIIILLLLLVMIFSLSASKNRKAVKSAQTTNAQLQTQCQTIGQNLLAADAKVQTMVAEQSRCSTLISRPQGDFGDYDYCKKFLQKFPLP